MDGNGLLRLISLVCLAFASCVTVGGVPGLANSEQSSNEQEKSTASRDNTAEPEVLYNGIELPKPWPPYIKEWTPEPPPRPYYIVNPPKVIPIDVGRQLFVDDFLIEQTTLTRQFHKAEYYDKNPILRPDKPWEERMSRHGQLAGAIGNPGVWYDPTDNLFKMWYLPNCYATSVDGLHWDKPSLDVEPGTNIVGGAPQLWMVWLDHEEKNPQRRFKAICGLRPTKTAFAVKYSADGIHWSEPVAETGIAGDTTTFFYNPFRQIWAYSVKENISKLRRRCYWECSDLATGSYWTDEQHFSSKWVRADSLDPVLPETPIAQIYRLDCVAYESLILGMFTIWRGEPEDRFKPNNILLGFSRDGFTWDRTSRDAFIAVSEKYGDWNWCYMQSSGGCCLVVGDKLYFYVQGRAGEKGPTSPGTGYTGLAMLRRDGFASMNAEDSEGTLVTRPVVFKGKYLFVNVDAAEGQLDVEVLDEKGEVIAPFTRDNCISVSVDKTLQAVNWKGVEDLSSLAGKPVKFKFHLKNGKLYSFWVSPDRNGASRGYVAAGGPGFTGPTDGVIGSSVD